MSKILLGIIKQNIGTFADGELVYLDQHKWFDWYWSFGWLGNRNTHFHFESFLEKTLYASELFETTKITDDDWWVIRDLFKQAYAIQKAAAVYRYGGNQTTREGVTDIIKDDVIVTRLNADLKKVLDVLWDFISEKTK